MQAKKQGFSEPIHLEIEVKLKIRNLEQTRQQILLLGFEPKVAQAFEENWIFDFPNRSLAQNHCLFRLRQFEDKCLVTFKGPSLKSSGFKVREELETQLEDRAIFYRILERLGLVLVFRYQKYRSIFERRVPRKRGKVVLSLDQTPIGNYLEIEGSQREIEMIASQLGYSKGDFITESYPGLYAKIKPLSESREMVFSESRRDDGC